MKVRSQNRLAHLLTNADATHSFDRFQKTSASVTALLVVDGEVVVDFGSATEFTYEDPPLLKSGRPDFTIRRGKFKFLSDYEITERRKMIEPGTRIRVAFRDAEGIGVVLTCGSYWDVIVRVHEVRPVRAHDSAYLAPKVLPSDVRVGLNQCQVIPDDDEDGDPDDGWEMQAHWDQRLDSDFVMACRHAERIKF